MNVLKQHDPGQWPCLQRQLELETPVAPAHSLFVRLSKKFIPGFQSPSPFALNDQMPPGIYILIYHSVVNLENRREWERCYSKGETTTISFSNQMDWFLRHMVPIRLSEAPSILEKSDLDKPYFAVTFDDGFENLLRNALPITQARKIYPTVFVNGAFANGEETLFRVLSAVLTSTGGEKTLAKALNSKIPDVRWDKDPTTLFNQTKTHYRPNAMEKACEEAFRAHHGGSHQDLKTHLSVDEVRHLSEQGWEVGNHTYAHRLLGTLDVGEVFSSIEHNRDFWSEAGIDLVPFLAYPVGRLQDINKYVHQWLEQNPEIHSGDARLAKASSGGACRGR